MSKSRLSKDEAIKKIAEAVGGRKVTLVIVPKWLHESSTYVDLDAVIGAPATGNGRWVHQFEILIDKFGNDIETHHLHPQPTTLEIMNASTRRKAKHR